MALQKEPYVWSIPQKAGLIVGLLIWLGAAYFIGINQVVATQELTPFRPIALTALIPVGLFLMAYVASERFKAFVLAQDLRLLTAFQLWRVIGFTFLTLYAFGVLPGLFAWPAGLGDVAVGVLAAFVLIRMVRDASFVKTKSYLGLHFAGLFDFLIAIVMASLSSGAFPGLTHNGLTSGAMEVWPLNLFPSFLVPLFIILHLSALFQVMQLRRPSNDGISTEQIAL